MLPAFGFWVETVNEKCEGLVSVRDLSDYDDFRHDDADYALVGLHTGKKFRMGDKIKVKLVAANLEKRQLDFEWIPGVESLKTKAEVKNKIKKHFSKKNKVIICQCILLKNSHNFSKKNLISVIFLIIQKAFTMHHSTF